MKKDELIKLKRKMETKVYKENAYSGSGPISLFEIEQKVNTKGAVENIEKYFESLISYFSSRDIAYDEITLRPLFSVVVEEKDLDEKTIIKTNCKPLSNVVAVTINGFYCMNAGQKFDEDPDIIYPGNFNEYIVVFDEFIRQLVEKGFYYAGVDTIEELKEQIITRKPTFGDITLSFAKRKLKINKFYE